jgi:signal transduction histidine kinase
MPNWHVMPLCKALLNSMMNIHYNGLVFVAVWLAIILSACHHNPSSKEDNNGSWSDSLLLIADKKMTSNPDSAMALSEKALNYFIKTNDSMRLANGYLVMGRVWAIKGDSKEALKCFNRVDALLGNNGPSNVKASNMLEIGKLHYDWGQFDSSFVCFTSAHQMADLLHDSLLLGESYYQLGKYYHTTGRFSQSMHYYKNALEITTKFEDKSLNVNILLSIGKNYLNQGNTSAALENYQKAYQASMPLTDKLAKADACNHLGSIYLKLMKPQTSIDYHRLALHWRTEMQNFNGMAKSHNNMGESFIALAMADSALYHFGRSLEVSTKIYYHKGTVKALNNIALASLTKGNINKALKTVEQALELSVKSGYSEGEAEAYLTMGELFQKNNQFIEAQKQFDSALKIAKLAVRSDLLKRSYDNIYLANKQLGRVSEALVALESATDLKLAHLETQKNRQIAEMQILFESEKKERENEVLKQQNALHALSISRKNNLLIVSAISVVFLMVIVTMVYQRWQRNKKANWEMHTLNSQLEAAIGERDKLMSIIAHELRNPLFWFQSLTQMLSKNYKRMSAQNIEKSLLSLDESAKNAFHLMDNLLNWSRSKLNRVSPKMRRVPLQPLIQQNQRLFETIAEHKGIQLRIACPNDLAVYTDEDLLDTIVRNLLSNAIKFTPVDGCINIDCTIKYGNAQIAVADSGSGLSPDMHMAFTNNEPSTIHQGILHEKGTGFGLKLCKEFAELIGGELGIGKSSLGGACLWVSIPIDTVNIKPSIKEQIEWLA